MLRFVLPMHQRLTVCMQWLGLEPEVAACSLDTVEGLQAYNKGAPINFQKYIDEENARVDQEQKEFGENDSRVAPSRFALGSKDPQELNYRFAK
eukprot:15470077-Alexandrium_andersonii.AAC.1